MKECLTAYRTSSATLRVPPSPEGKAGNKALPIGEGARRAGEVKPKGKQVSYMGIITYREDLKHKSQILRKEMTKEERHLWYDFLKTYSPSFRRQLNQGAEMVHCSIQSGKNSYWQNRYMIIYGGGKSDET